MTLAAVLAGAVAAPASAAPDTAPATTGAVSNHSLTTTFQSTNGSAGSAFDLEVKPATGVRIDSLDVNLNGTSIPVSVYTRPGVVGTNTSTLDGWTLRDTVAVTSIGYNKPTPVPISFHLTQGTWGVAVIHNSGRDASFGNSYLAGPVFADDALTLTTSGSWNSPAFASQYFRNYAWNGTLHYTDQVSAVIESGPIGPTREDAPAFAYSADGPNESAAYEFECELSPPEPGGALGYSPCPAGGTGFTDLPEGAYTFSVTATDATHGATSDPVTRSFTVDTSAPSTTVDTGPTGSTGSNDPSFTYTGTAGDTDRFECDLTPAEPGGNAGFTACPDAGTSFTDLAEGDYTFSVRALDTAGNADPTPATRDFTVDTTAPDTLLATGPAGPTNDADPTFTYAASPTADVAGFECALTPGAGFAPCPSDGTGYTGLTDGDYTFAVRAIDQQDNVDQTPATQAFTVDTSAPSTTVDTGPTGSTGSNDPSFTYTGTAGDTDRFECDLTPAEPGGNAGFTACPDAGTSFTDLAEGDYTFSVRALDTAGNADPTPATRDFTVDTAAPTLTAALTSDAAPRAGWYRLPVRLTYACADAGSPLMTPCPAAVTLHAREHTVTRSITTADGNTAAVTSEVRIDRVSPRFELRRFNRDRVYTTKPAVRCVATDNRSGVRVCKTRVQISDNRRRVVVTVRVVDHAGNVRIARRSAAYRPR